MYNYFLIPFLTRLYYINIFNEFKSVLFAATGTVILLLITFSVTCQQINKIPHKIPQYWFFFALVARVCSCFELINAKYLNNPGASYKNKKKLDFPKRDQKPHTGWINVAVAATADVAQTQLAAFFLSNLTTVFVVIRFALYFSWVWNVKLAARIMSAGRIVVYGGKGALGSACVQHFKANNYVSLSRPFTFHNLHHPSP